MNSSNQIIEFDLNEPQAKVHLVQANETWCPWSRGTGKTVGVIALWILHKAENMPRSNGGLIGQTFEDLETKILQPIFQAFTMLGYEKDVHFVYGKKPPEDWDKPLTPIIKYDRVLTFRNGTTMELISLRLKGSANGKSLQWIVGDEAKLLNENQLREEVFPILRGHEKVFGVSPWYGAKLFVTDKHSPNIHWLLAKKKLMNEGAVKAVMYYQLQVNDLRQKMGTVSDRHGRRIKHKINRLEMLLAALRKNLVYYIEAKASDNVKNLGKDYFKNMKRSLTAYEYSISIENEDPTKAEHGFYPDRNDTHVYLPEIDKYTLMVKADEDHLKPLAITMDWQASITPLVWAQVNDLVVPGVTTLNFLGAIYVKHPQGKKDVIQEFCKQHKNRPCKEVVLFYDHTANAKKNMHKKDWEEVQEYFIAEGWICTAVNMGQAPLQSSKFSRINYFLRHDDKTKWPIRINLESCASMLLSMDNSGIKETDQGTGKDKADEKNMSKPQELTTHFSDTFDQMVWAVLERELYPVSSSFHVALGLRK